MTQRHCCRRIAERNSRQTYWRSNIGNIPSIKRSSEKIIFSTGRLWQLLHVSNFNCVFLIICFIKIHLTVVLTRLYQREFSLILRTTARDFDAYRICAVFFKSPCWRMKLCRRSNLWSRPSFYSTTWICEKQVLCQDFASMYVQAHLILGCPPVR